MRRLLVTALFTASVAAGGAPAHAATVRDCTSQGTWTFTGLSLLPSVGQSVVINAVTTCLVYTSPTSFSQVSYTSQLGWTYSGTCAAAVLSTGIVNVGAMVAGQAITATGAGLGGIVAGAHVITNGSAVSCSTIPTTTTLATYFHWVTAGP